MYLQLSTQRIITIIIISNSTIYCCQWLLTFVVFMASPSWKAEIKLRDSNF